MTDYYVDPVSGSNGNAGTSTGAAWATLQFAADTAVAGDEVFLMSTGTESTATQIDFDTNAGTRTNPIKFTGANGSGVRLTSGHYTVQASASMTNLIAPTTASNFVRFNGVDFDGNSNVTGNCVDGGVTNEGIGWHILRCMAHSAGGDGINFRGSVSPQVIVADCDVFDNGGNGIAPLNGATSRWGDFAITGNRVYNNGGQGIGNFNAQTLWILANVVYGNTGDGIGNIAGTSGSPVGAIAQNILFDNGGDGIDISALENHLAVFNNIMRSNAGYGLRQPATTQGYIGFVDYNCYHNNTLGNSDATLPGDFDVLANPLFTNEGAGTENFLLAPGSPCHLAGVHGGAMGIGSANDDTGGGGGGGAVGGIFNGSIQ